MATLTNGHRTFYDVPDDDAQAMADLWNDETGEGWEATYSD